MSSDNNHYLKIWDKLVSYLAVRDHSETELKQKLNTKFPHSTSLINQALSEAKERNYLIDPTELSLKVAQELGGKLKGHLFINQYLKKKGLPSVSLDRESEINHALTFLEKKSSRLKASFSSYDKKAKLYRALMNRGYDQACANEALGIFFNQEQF